MNRTEVAVHLWRKTTFGLGYVSGVVLSRLSRLSCLGPNVANFGPCLASPLPCLAASIRYDLYAAA